MTLPKRESWIPTFLKSMWREMPLSSEFWMTQEERRKTWAERWGKEERLIQVEPPSQQWPYGRYEKRSLEVQPQPDKLTTFGPSRPLESGEQRIPIPPLPYGGYGVQGGKATPAEKLLGEWILPGVLLSSLPTATAGWKALGAAKSGLIGAEPQVARLFATQAVPKAMRYVGKAALAIPYALEQAPGVPLKAVSKVLASTEQKLEAHRIARQLGLLKPEYEKLAMQITGKKSMTEMNADEAARFIQALGKSDIALPFQNVSNQIAAKQAKALSYELAESMGGVRPKIGIVTKETTKRTVRDRIAQAKEGYLANVEFVENMMLKADGMKEGKVFQTFIRSTDDATDMEIFAEIARRKGLEETLAKLGLRLDRMLNEVVEVAPGVRLTALERIGIYLHSKNLDNWRHVIKGNFRGLVKEQGYKKTDTFFRGVAEGLTPQEKAFGDYMFDIAQAGTPEVAAAYKAVTGKDMKVVDNYWRIILREFDDIEIDPMMKVLVGEYQKRFPSAKIKKGFTLARTGHAQQPIELDAVEVFLRYSKDVEHYKAFMPLVRDLQRIYGNARFSNAFKGKMGEAKYKAVGEWMADISSTDPLALVNTREGMLRTLRVNATTGVLGLGLPIAFKQLPSFLLGVTEVGASNAMRGLLKTISPVAYQETKSLMAKVSPQMFKRVMVREIAEIQASKSLAAQMAGKKSWREWAMILTLTTDRLATTSIWRGAYDKAIKQGMSEMAAGRFALQITRRTQPFFSIKDVPGYWRSGEGMRMLVMFQNQLSRNYNYVNTHILSMMKAGKISKPEAMRRFTEGIVIPAMMIGVISSGRMPKDGEDFARNSIRPLVAMFPVIGPIAASAIGGFYDASTPVTLQVFREFQRAVYYANDGEWGKFLLQATKAGLYRAGVPVNAPERFIEGLVRIAQGKSSDWLELIWGEYVRREAQQKSGGTLPRSRIP